MAVEGNEEIELKLELAPAAADALAASGLHPDAPRIVRQHAIYFDTPGHDLSAAGLTLRIRREGAYRIQTVKASGAAAAGLFARPEWERPALDDRPVIDDATPIPALLGKKVEHIAPLFAVEIERRIWTLQAGQSEIEIALDRGRAVAGDRETPICEIELERKGGDAAALFALARRIDAAAPVRLGVLGKADRGYRLLGPAPGAAKAAAIPLTPDMDAAAAFQRIAQACLHQFRLNENLILDRRDADALHQARVALRRLRSALAIHKEMLADSRFESLAGELRWLAAELGEARNLDVLIDRAVEKTLHAQLQSARDGVYDAVQAALHSHRARALMIDLAEWIAIGEWRSEPDGQALRETPARAFAGQALDRFRRKVKKSGRDLARLDDEARHEARKAAKKLRYAAEFFAALYDARQEKRRRKTFLGALETLQDRLGALNDLASAPDLLSRIGLDAGPAISALRDSGGKTKLIAGAAKAYVDFTDAKRFWR